MSDSEQAPEMRESLQQAIRFGSAEIRFQVDYRPRKHIGITVRPDLSVVVAVPEGVSIGIVKERVRRRAPWILKQLDRFELYRPHPTPRQYLNGETHRYLGRQYRLRIVESASPSVKLKGRYLKVATVDAEDRDVIRSQVNRWYSSHARAMFERRMELALTRLPQFAAHEPKLVLRSMKTRWGSCSRTGRVLLNTELVQAPVECIDYVIVHELCHLEVPDHSSAFYNLLGRHMPDWRIRKKRLESLGI